MRIKTKMLLIFSSIIIFMLIALFVISNRLISSRFNIYAEQKSNESLARLEQQIIYRYKLTHNWKIEELENIAYDYQAQGILFDLVDASGNMLIVHQGTQMGKGMGHGSMHHAQKEQLLHSIELNDEDSVIGYILLYSFPESSLSRADVGLRNALNSTFLISAALAALIGIILAMVMSRGLSKPILQVSDVSRAMADGNYDLRATQKTNTRELKDLARSINHLAEEIQEEQMLRKRLTSDISHELRTPLTSLLGTIESIQMGVWDADQKRLNALANDGKQIERLVEKFVSLAQYDFLQHTQDKKEMIDFTSYFDNLSARFEAIAHENMNTINIDIEPAKIFSDRSQMDQIFNNIVANAIQYTRNGSIFISSRNEEDRIVIKVKDNGIGIAEKDIPFVFERLYRSDLSRSRYSGGMGIGLSLVKAAIAHLNWEIRLESVLGEGSEFSIIIV